LSDQRAVSAGAADAAGSAAGLAGLTGSAEARWGAQRRSLRRNGGAPATMSSAAVSSAAVPPAYGSPAPPGAPGAATGRVRRRPPGSAAGPAGPADPPPAPAEEEPTPGAASGRALPAPQRIWRLRARGCWTEAAALLEPFTATDPAAALGRAALLVEECLFTAEGWAEAESALRQAEAAARSDRDRAAAACERGQLAYCSTLLGEHDRLDEAQAALGRASALLEPDDPLRPLLHYRRGLIAENGLHDRAAARAAYLRAHAGAERQNDDLLRSDTWRQLAGLAQQDGNLAGARHGFAESLRLREECGFAIGVAPALASLAEVSTAAEAAQLRAEADRLVRAFGGAPVWLTPSR